jgi:hypothetical protein
MSEPNPAATGLASSTSMRCDANRRPGIGTVRNESAAEVTARCRHAAALSLLLCDSSRSRVMAKLDSIGTVPMCWRASSRRQADGIVSAAELQAFGNRNTLAVRAGSRVEDARRPYGRVESRRDRAGFLYE